MCASRAILSEQAASHRRGFEELVSQLISCSSQYLVRVYIRGTLRESALHYCHAIFGRCWAVMAVNLKKHKDRLLAAFNDVLSDSSSTNWCDNDDRIPCLCALNLSLLPGVELYWYLMSACSCVNWRGCVCVLFCSQLFICQIAHTISKDTESSSFCTVTSVFNWKRGLCVRVCVCVCKEVQCCWFVTRRGVVIGTEVMESTPSTSICVALCVI